MSVSVQRQSFDQAPLRPSLEGILDSQQHTSSLGSVPQAVSDDQEYLLQEKRESIMSSPVVHPGAEGTQLASVVDTKEAVEHVDPVKHAITLEEERMAAYTGPKVSSFRWRWELRLTRYFQIRVKILLMSSQNHVFTFEPETPIGRVVCVRRLRTFLFTEQPIFQQKEAIWYLWPAGELHHPVFPTILTKAFPSSDRLEYGSRETTIADLLSVTVYGKDALG